MLTKQELAALDTAWAKFRSGLVRAFEPEPEEPKVVVADARAVSGHLDRPTEWPIKVPVWSGGWPRRWLTTPIQIGDRVLAFVDLGCHPEGPDPDVANESAQRVGLVFKGIEPDGHGQWLIVIDQDPDAPAHPLGLPAWMARRHA